MEQTLQQLAILDALLTNWELIRVRMGPISAALSAQFNELGQRLRKSPGADELALIVDDLLDLTSGTAAEEYVNSLIARNDLGESGPTRGAAPVRTTIVVPEAVSFVLPDMSSKMAASLGITLERNSVVSDVARVPIFFSTNRAATSIAVTGFTGEFQKQLTFGVATVTVPVSHKAGELETPAWWNVFADKNDKASYFTLAQIVQLRRAEFEGRLENAAQSAKTAELLIFLHGFNVTFEEAAMRAAQFVCDSKFNGIVVLFSWPSQGKLLGYSGDEERAYSTGDLLATFLSGLGDGPWTRVHLLAHSMGNRVMLLGLADNPRPRLKLGQIVFAAADVFVPMFEEKWAKLQGAGLLRATSYASKDDRALLVSSILHSGPRIGLVGDAPFVTEHLEAIDATSVDQGILGHGYWSAVPALLSDLKGLLQDGKSPKDRALKPMGNYWAFPS